MINQEMIECACGCRRLRTKYDLNGHLRKYLSGHNNGLVNAMRVQTCHAKTGINRSHWIKFFQSMLSQKYQYQYTPEGKIIMQVPL